MAAEDVMMGALKKSEQPKKSKIRKEKNNDMVAGNPVQIVEEVGVGDKSFEEENLTKMKSDNEGVERRKEKKKTARDNKVEALMEDTNGIAAKKAEKRKRKREIKSNDYEREKSFEEENVTKMKSNNEDVERRKEKKKRARYDEGGAIMEDTNGITAKKSKKSKRKREVESNDYELHAISEDTANDVSADNGGYTHSTATKMHENNRKHEKRVGTITDGCTEGKTEKVKRKKKKNKKGKREETQASGVENDNTSQERVKSSSEDRKLKNSKKKVRFSSELKVYPESNVPESGKDQSEEVELVRGKRFSKQEDEVVKEAVYKYIEVHNLGEDGLNMVLNSRSHPELKNCWKEIGAAIPNRPYTSVYYRAQVLFRRDENHKWTEEEKALILKHHKLNGSRWKELADELGKHRWHVKDTWRRIKLPNMKRGHWSQEEYQTLFDLVNTDLQLKANEEKKSKHGMLRDNICWTAVSDKLSTRNGPACCVKWYQQLTSPMVAEGIWSDADDYRLISALYNLDATCIENVDWDNLLDHRSGEICLKRWKQMVLCIGNHGNKPFSEQVEVLSKRYCPSLTEARETWDSKPVVP